jgi:hypothetical protein
MTERAVDGGGTTMTVRWIDDEDEVPGRVASDEARYGLTALGRAVLCSEGVQARPIAPDGAHGERAE